MTTYTLSIGAGSTSNLGWGGGGGGGAVVVQRPLSSRGGGVAQRVYRT